MPDYQDIFRNQADKYDALVEREDYEGKLIPALCDIVSFTDTSIVEFGAGTGRLSRLLVPKAAFVTLFEASPAMLKVAVKRLALTGLSNWKAEVADNRSVPFDSELADISIAGWSICCLVTFSGPEWKPEVAKAIEEMERVVKKGGTILIIETLGTGHESPIILPGLADYIDMLKERGYKSRDIRTDYKFDTLEEAEDLTRFFFGEDIVPAIKPIGSAFVLPECTGIWWKKKGGE